MTDPAHFARGIVITTRVDLRPLATAVAVTEELLFHEGMSIDDIHVTKDIYPVVAKRLNMKLCSVSRSIVRSAHRCWEKMTDTQRTQIIGRPIPYMDAPSDMIFFLAVYLHTGKPFYSDAAFRVSSQMLD